MSPRGIEIGSERGITLAELLMGMFTFLIVFTAILTMVQASFHNQDRVVKRVAANQRARPVMTKIIDALHSACVAPAIAPVLPGSTSNSISFTSKAGSSVNPIPDKRVYTLSGTTLSEQVYPETNGEPPWAFSATPSLSRVVLEGVGQGSVGDPPVPVPVFRYYAYVGGQLDPTPLPVPLSADDAARTVHVDVAFATSPGTSGASSDPKAPFTLTDSTTLRLEPASEDSAEVNLPCV